MGRAKKKMDTESGDTTAQDRAGNEPREAGERETKERETKERGGPTRAGREGERSPESLESSPQADGIPDDDDVG